MATIANSVRAHEGITGSIGSPRLNLSFLRRTSSRICPAVERQRLFPCSRAANSIPCDGAVHNLSCMHCFSMCLFIYLFALLACMYVFMYACMYACMYVCLFACLYVCLFVCSFVGHLLAHLLGSRPSGCCVCIEAGAPHIVSFQSDVSRNNSAEMRAKLLAVVPRR